MQRGGGGGWGWHGPHILVDTRVCVLNLVRLKHTLKQAKIKIDLSLWKTLMVHGKFLESHGICRAKKSLNGNLGKFFDSWYTLSSPIFCRQKLTVKNFNF